MDKLLSIKDVMQILGLGRSTVYELCRTRQIPHVRIKRRVLIPESALNEFVTKHSVSTKNLY